MDHLGIAAARRVPTHEHDLKVIGIDSHKF